MGSTSSLDYLFPATVALCLGMSHICIVVAVTTALDRYFSNRSCYSSAALNPSHFPTHGMGLLSGLPNTWSQKKQGKHGTNQPKLPTLVNHIILKEPQPTPGHSAWPKA
jgi:hypothetical protein